MIEIYGPYVFDLLDYYLKILDFKNKKYIFGDPQNDNLSLTFNILSIIDY